jgi:hypothetical protein
LTETSVNVIPRGNNHPTSRHEIIKAATSIRKKTPPEIRNHVLASAADANTQAANIDIDELWRRFCTARARSTAHRAADDPIVLKAWNDRQRHFTAGPRPSRNMIPFPRGQRP